MSWISTTKTAILLEKLGLSIDDDDADDVDDDMDDLPAINGDDDNEESAIEQVD